MKDELAKLKKDGSGKPMLAHGGGRVCAEPDWRRGWWIGFTCWCIRSCWARGCPIFTKVEDRLKLRAGGVDCVSAGGGGRRFMCWDEWRVWRGAYEDAPYFGNTNADGPKPLSWYTVSSLPKP